MLRGWKGIAISFAVAALLFAGAVLHAVQRPAEPRGFSGLSFANLSPAAAARTPMLARGGAQIAAVIPGSPADKAGLKADEVVAALDGTRITSARQAAELVRAGRVGAQLSVTLYDITKGEVKPRSVTLQFEHEPPPKKTFSVHPPPVLADEEFNPVTVAANASWSPRIFRGATIRPRLLSGLGAGQCNAFAPEGWRVAAHAPDNSLFHVMATEGFLHAVYKSGALNGASPDAFLRDFLVATFKSRVMLTPPQSRPFGFAVRDFGNAKGGAGFVLYRVSGNRIALWTVAVAGAEAGWAKPLAGAVALSMRCAAPGTPAPLAPAPQLPPTATSLRCQQGACTETDFAAAYMTVLRLGYVHNRKGEMFLVKPKQDFWQSGAEGPGFYHQIGGENEKLEPGRIN
jgi:hypothetical protein